MHPAHTSIPCLPGLPLLGNIFSLRYQRLDLLTRISQRYGDIGAFHFGPRVVPMLNSPELVRAALVDQHMLFEKTATVTRLGSPVIGNGLFLSEGEKHHQHRRLIAPLFQHRRVLRYAERMLNSTIRLQEAWQEGEIINLGTEMTRLTLWIISSVLFGVDASGEESELGEALSYTFRHFASAVTNPIHLPQSWPTPRNRQSHRSLARVNATIYHMLAQRRASHEASDDDFLSLLLRNQDEGGTPALTDQEMRDEALSLFVAGHETTANALTWCWYLLSQHPDVYAHVQSEVDLVLNGRSPTSADLPKLPYTLQVFQETLRLYPPVYAFTRKAITSVQLEHYTIPQDASVVISPYTLHRRASLFPDPERFDPDRFSSQKIQERERYAYIPFSAGPRICLGMHFALLEGHLILATLVQRLTFEFTGINPLAPEPLLTLRPREAVLMKVHYR